VLLFEREAMSIFIKKDDRVSVSVDGGTNVVWVRRKMDLGTQNRLQDALMSVDGVNMGTRTFQRMDVNMGRYNTLLLQMNIIDWEGPDFRDESERTVPCTPQAIESLDPDAPLVDAVLSRINELNRKAVVVEAGKPVDPLLSTTALSGNGKSVSAPKRHA
jgi:hypothetical protein